MLVESEGIDVYEAFDRLRTSNAFTTHTPVEAGHDRFHPDLAYRHLSWWSKAVGIDGYQLLDLGRWPNNTDPESPFNMTLLAMRASHKINGVAGLHGEVSREMFARYWPGTPVDEVPITHVTNGVHAPSWQLPALHTLLSSAAVTIIEIAQVPMSAGTRSMLSMMLHCTRFVSRLKGVSYRLL